MRSRGARARREAQIRRSEALQEIPSSPARMGRRGEHICCGESPGALHTPPETKKAVFSGPCVDVEGQSGREKLVAWRTFGDGCEQKSRKEAADRCNQWLKRSALNFLLRGKSCLPSLESPLSASEDRAPPSVQVRHRLGQVKPSRGSISSSHKSRCV
jgi:hypothetical protein